MSIEIQIKTKEFLNQLKKEDIFNKPPIISNNIISLEPIKSFSINYENRILTVNCSELGYEEYNIIKYLLLTNNKEL